MMMIVDFVRNINSVPMQGKPGLCSSFPHRPSSTTVANLEQQMIFFLLIAPWQADQLVVATARETQW